MPMIDADGCLINVSVEGRDDGPTLMLSNSLGCTLQMWEPQMKALTQVFRVIRYDRRGHGKSSAPPGPYSMERFTRNTWVSAFICGSHICKVQPSEFDNISVGPSSRPSTDTLIRHPSASIIGIESFSKFPIYRRARRVGDRSGPVTRPDRPSAQTIWRFSPHSDAR